MMKSEILIPLSLLTCIFVSCKMNEDARGIMRKNVPEPQEISVRVIQVWKSDNEGAASYVGTVEAGRSATLSTHNSGTVSQLRVKVGDYVRKGQAIATIESQSIRSGLEASEASLRQAEDGWARIEKVRESRSVTEVKVVEVQTKLEQARATEKASRKSVDDMILRAPFDGVVSEVMSTDGVQIGIAQPVVEIVDISSVEIHFPLPENEYSQVRVGSPASVSIPAVGITDMTAYVSTKGAIASKLSHSYDCTLLSEGRMPEGVMPGMVCKILLRNKGENACIIPASAVMTDMNGRYVWTATLDTVEKKYIVVGGYSGNGIVVTEGLDEGDLVIVEGGRKVSTGMKVKTVR